VALVALLAVGAGAGYVWYLNHEVHRVNVQGLTNDPTTGADAGTENILMVGSTSRCALKVQNPAYGLCTEGVTGVNSDVVMILHLNPSTGAVSILSIPRDLFVPNARASSTQLNPTGANKIDAALLQGPTQLVAAIEDDFGIPIQHFVELNFDSFAGVVTALGGITMYFPEPVYDAYSGLDQRTTGCHHLDGVEALQVVRARHLQYRPPGNTSTTPSTWPQESQSDLARIVRDHEFLRVLARKVAKRGISNPATDLSLVSSVAPQLTVDSELSLSAMVNLVLTYHRVTVEKAPQLTVPVLVGTFGSYDFKGGTYGDVEFPTEPLDQSVVDQFLGVTDDTNTMTGAPLARPGSVSVSVEDGSGVYGQATQTAQALSGLGFNVVSTGTTTPVGREAETVVTYAHHTAADEAAAQLVARSLSGSVIMAYGPTSGSATVTVTTGTGFTVDAAAPAPASSTSTTAPKATATTTTSTTAPSATTVTPTTATANPSGATPSNAEGFDAPSSSNEPLSPWDPRSCTPSGGPGS
jgi:LCP family protein required for cell wall assembly